MRAIKKYLVRKWSETVRSVYADLFKINEIDVVRVKKGKIREWRAYKDGVRLSKDELRKYKFNVNNL